MAELFDIDPVTGIRTDLHWDEANGKVTLERTANVNPVRDYAMAVANEVGVNKEDIRKGFWLYAKLPPIVILQMRAKGINIFDKGDSDRMFREINESYPELKCTTGNEGKKGKLIVL